jgi:hypothetical protein
MRAGRTASRVMIALAASSLVAVPVARAEKEALAQFKAILARELQLEKNHKALLAWLTTNVFTTYKDCGTGKNDVAIDPRTWEYGFLFEYYPADRGKPPTTPDFVPSCYSPVPLCFRRDANAELEFDMKRYKDFPDTNECGLTATRFTIKEPYPKIEIKSVLYEGTIRAKLKYWEKRTSFARIAAAASKREAPRRARAGEVVVGLGYGNVVVDVHALGSYLGVEREVEFLGPFESPHRRFCYTDEIVARSGDACAPE